MDMDRRRRRLLRSSRASQSSRTRRTFRADNLTTVETSTWASQRRHTHKGGIQGPGRARCRPYLRCRHDRRVHDPTDEERLDVCETPAQARAATGPSGR